MIWSLHHTLLLGTQTGRLPGLSLKTRYRAPSQASSGPCHASIPNCCVLPRGRPQSAEYCHRIALVSRHLIPHFLAFSNGSAHSSTVAAGIRVASL